MGLQALKIVDEEFNKEGDRAYRGLADLAKLRKRIVRRIEKECIEIPEVAFPDVQDDDSGLGITQEED